LTDHLRIAPFAGVRYSSEKVPDISPVVAPPYDMISPAEQEKFYSRHPYNVVRLILTREEEDGLSSRYERAASYYRQWRQEGVLRQDSEPSIYAYRQDYEWGGERYQRLGFIARVALTEFGEGAYPHETTMSGPKADRLRLLTACRANFSPIFSLFSDAGGQVQDRLAAETASAPEVAFEDENGVAHRLWRLSRPEFHSWINGQMYKKQFIIADGHHRYETALEYRRQMRENPGSFRGDYDYVMMFLAPIESSGLRILPFHRLLTIDDPAAIPAKVGEVFELTEHPAAGSGEETGKRILDALAAEPSDKTAFVYYGGKETFIVLRVKEGVDLSSRCREGTSPEVAELDVTVLHHAIFENLLGLEEPRLVQEGKMAFIARPEDIVTRVREMDGGAAFFLRPTQIDQVWDIAVSGRKMPQKSTNFHPKLITGLVINEL
jgi:uncharacterized protein (DUF1015 family)